MHGNVILGQAGESLPAREWIRPPLVAFLAKSTTSSLIDEVRLWPEY